MKIDELPVEILMKIFSYLPNYDNVYLVNKQFYNVVCKVAVSLSMDQTFFEDDDNVRLLEGIQNSIRNITRLCITLVNPTDSQFQSIISLIKTFSTTIKCLIFNLHGRPLTMLECLEILSSIPNAKHLAFGYLRLLTDNQTSQKNRHFMTRNTDLNLHQLKTLEFNCCNDKFMLVFNRLPIGALAELKWSGFSRELNSLHVLLKRQTNIKKLSVYCMRGYTNVVDIGIFDNLKLESLVWYIKKNNGENTNIATILSNQTKLKCLNLLVDYADEGLMNAVATHLTELESLSIKNPERPYTTFININKLEKLKNLTLHGGFGGTASYESFLKFDKSRITTLDLCDIRLPVNNINTFAKSLPNLKVLRYACNIGYITLKAILRSFNFVEVLKIENLYDLLDDDRNIYEILGDCVNPKLMELKIDCLFINSGTLLAFVEKFIADYRNLKKLVLRSTTPLAASLFKLILNSFTKMESLALVFNESELTIKDLCCIKDQNKNFRFIYIKGLRVTTKLKNELCSMFHDFDIAFDKCGFAIAINRTTMKHEKELLGINS